MESIHNAIAWYQKKIGSYDKQLWEQSVERKLQKGLANVHHAPRKTVRLKTEYIDVDLIRGSSFTKTKPQVPWIYITRKAFVRVLFFPFYYRWWVLQTSKKVFYCLLSLWLLQAATTFIFFVNLDGTLIEDELTLTEVVVPIGLMFLLGLIHAQTVLAHFSLKPPRRDARSKRKQKKRSRLHSHASSPHTDLAHDMGLADPKPHRHTASLWSASKVEVCPPSPSLSTHRQGALYRTRGVKRAEKKNVRIVDATQQTYSQTQFYTSAKMEENGCGVAGQRLSNSTDEGVVLSPDAARANSSPERALGKAWSKKADVEAEKTLADGKCGVNSVCSVAKANDKNSFSRLTCKKERDQSISGIDDCCDSGAPCESGRGPCDTTDSDSLAGRFEIIHLEGKGLQQEVVKELMESVGSKESSNSFHDYINPLVVIKSESSDGLTDAVDSERVVRPSESSDGLTDIVGSQVCGPYNAVKLSENTLTSSSVSFGKLSQNCLMLATLSHSQRGSASEDGMTDHREEDNFSDTGHVSNSSNYNPSDSGSDAEPGDLDTVGMPIPRNSGLSCSTLENESAANCVPSPSSLPSISSLPSSPRKMAQQSPAEGESSASDTGSPDARQSVSGVLRRRRRANSSQGIAASEQSESQVRTRPFPPKLLNLRLQNKLTQTSGVSSSENEAGGLSPEALNKATVSSEEWEDRMQSDVTTSSSYSTSNSESELTENNDSIEVNEDEDNIPTNPFHDINPMQPPTSTNPANQPDKVSCVIWEGNECKKLDLTALDIGWAIIDKVDNLPESSDYIFIGVFLSFCLGCVPCVYRFYSAKSLPQGVSPQPFLWLLEVFKNNSWTQNLIICSGFTERLALSCIFFFLLTVTDRTFKQRLLYAKHFSYLTSSRRARKFDMPHFRLNKVRNIKIWLSLRSYLKRRGPQRSVDVIVSASFYLSISLVCLMCIQMLKEAETYLDYLCNWELIVWCFALGIYIMRFMTLGLKINKKYRNLSVLITEQINLYLQMEQKPHKKEELTLANNVLRLAEDLLKELESPFKISGFSANPLIYNITKVVVLSAFSAVMTEVLGFKLKLYKIKLK